jgi:glucose/arabinose dehydrogenase
MNNNTLGQQEQQKQGPSLNILEKEALKVQEVVQGISFPTSMAFIDSSNLLILEKDGLVRLVSNGILQKQPVLKIPVDSAAERGLLGITTMNTNVSDNNNINKYDNDRYAKYGKVAKESKRHQQKYFFTSLNPGQAKN